MLENQYIDITPVAHSRQRASGTWSDGLDGRSESSGKSGNSEGSRSTAKPAQTYTGSPQPRPEKRSSRLSGAVQLVAGAGCVLVGIPLLILPGPGLLALGAGAALMVNGGRTLLGKLN